MEKYICKGHKYCSSRFTCSHAKPHEKITDCGLHGIAIKENEVHMCTCELTIETKRKNKLKNLNGKIHL